MEISENGRKSPKRLLIELSNEEHEIIKRRAADAHVTMRKYVLRAVVQMMKNEDKLKGII